MSGFNAKRLGTNLQNNFVVGLGRNRCAVGSITREYNYLTRTSQAPLCSLFNFNCLSPKPPGPTPPPPGPPTVPTAPTITNDTPFATSIEIDFTQSSNGGSVITNYEYSFDSGSSWTPFSPNITISPAIVSGLTTGQTYNINIRAVNALGAGPASTTVTATTVETIVVVNFTTVGPTGWEAPARISSVEYLVVAGGGGSGGGFDTGGGGGGGAGMVLTGSVSVTPGTIYDVVVGDGGAGGISLRGPPSSETNGSAGVNSVFDSITALGGGGGYASRSTSGVSSSGGNQVSGSTTASTGGSGGGSAGDGNGAGGGGGGNASDGSDGVTNTGGNGGSGVSSSISGSTVTYGVGGGGANGNVSSGNTAVAGSSNTGNGARGGGTASAAQTNGAKGGSGIVILKYSY